MRGRHRRRGTVTCPDTRACRPRRTACRGIRSAPRSRAGRRFRASATSGGRARRAQRRSPPPAAPASTRLVAFARERSPFYRDAYQGLPAGRLDPARLPIVTKRALMDRFDDWVTDPAIDLDGVTAFLADREHIGERYLGRYVIWKSSGSTGEPGIYVQDGDALETFDALMAAHLDPARFRRRARVAHRRTRRARRLGRRDGRSLRQHRVVAAPHPEQPVDLGARLLDHGAPAAAGGATQRLSAGVRRELSDDAGAARRRARGRPARDRTGEPVVGRRVPAARAGAPTSRPRSGAPSSTNTAHRSA